MSRGGKTSGQNSSAGHLARGTVFVLAGQSAFVVCGYVLHAYLGHAVDAATYGLYGYVGSCQQIQTLRMPYCRPGSSARRWSPPYSMQRAWLLPPGSQASLAIPV